MLAEQDCLEVMPEYGQSTGNGPKCGQANLPGCSAPPSARQGNGEPEGNEGRVVDPTKHEGEDELDGQLGKGLGQEVLENGTTVEVIV
jgi:hypothetical protein